MIVDRSGVLGCSAEWLYADIWARFRYRAAPWKCHHQPFFSGFSSPSSSHAACGVDISIAKYFACFGDFLLGHFALTRLRDPK